MPEYNVDSLFDVKSPYFNGAPNLAVPPSAQATGSFGPGSIGTGEQGAQLEAVATKLPEITVDADSPIQDAVDKLVTLGGGIINLLAGTYVIPALTGDSSIEIRGVSPSATILDANSTAGNLSFTGTSVYTTGTITSIASGVNVTGDSTAWLANVTAGQHLFLGTRWYQIAAVTGDTTLILAEGYGDNVTMPAAAYRIASVKQNITISNLAIKNSTGTGLVFTDCRRLTLDNILLLDNNKGMVFTNVSECNAERILPVSNTSNGVELTNVGISDWESVNSVSNGGSGFVLNNVKTMTFFPCSATANTADGFNITTGVDLDMLVEASGNGGQGMELVATNSGVVIKGIVSGNTSDGIKLTATSDNCKISLGTITGNGGYGVNIAASTCDNTIITSNTFASNSSGAVSDSGTGTIIRGNVGVSDNSTNAVSSYAHDVVTDSQSTAVNTDTVITCGFQPTVIVIDFRLKGVNNVTEKVTVGRGHWSGITNKSLVLLLSQVNTTTAITDSTYSQGSGDPAAGANGGGSSIVVTLSVSSVSATGFTVRLAYTVALGSTATATFIATAYK